MIYFNYIERKPNTVKVRKLKKIIKKIFFAERKTLSQISYVFCNDEYLLELNQKYLKHNTYTDIITFNLSNSESIINAEVYISVERVKENSKVLKEEEESEMARVVFHGSLHLCGYNDKTKGERAVMREKEDEFLKHYFKT